MQVHDDERLERDDIKECWHKNVTTCYDSYVTEFNNAEEEKCEDVFYKNCVIDFKEVPFDSEIQSCHVPLVKVCAVHSSIQGGNIPTQECSDDVDGDEICKTYSETTCDTTYDEEWQPDTSCSSHPRKVCAPDTCQVVQVDINITGYISHCPGAGGGGVHDQDHGVHHLPASGEV